MNKEEALNSRGGPQIIPRPTKWHLGEPSPWSHLSNKTLTIEKIKQAVEKYEPVVVQKDLLEEYTQEAGVLVALYEEQNSLQVILTRR